MRKLTVNRTSWMTYREVLANLEEFDTHGSLRGRKGSFDTGRMPSPWREEYQSRWYDPSTGESYIDYTVLSYATPIAWHDRELGWIMPDARYSNTTSKQQGRIAPGIASLKEGWQA